MSDLRTPAQSEQEPAAWIHKYIHDAFTKRRPADLNRHPDRWIPLYKNPTPCETCQSLARTVMMDQTSHDNPPPRREWQGLTDEEIVKFADEVSGEEHSVEDFARAIEAVLRSKNK